ncbi:Ubiquitin-associated domain [Dillenia turbinata]|uniref:Ubiquitin-associated domain n=1 Tax=Dillenia turbinata TaxID=194707 RepID=A0AAN8W333_9MAGN
MAKLKIAGIWSGVLEVELTEWTVAMLREEVAKKSNCGTESLNLIWAGKVLKDGDCNQNLSELGLKNNAKILSTRVCIDQGKSLKDELVAEEERTTRLSRLKAAANALAERHAGGSLPVEDFNIELEDQSGQKVNLGSETDQRAAMMGLMFHASAKQLIRRQKYKDALEVLEMGEEAFSLCNPKVIEFVDNVPILQIDMVWCYFMLRDIGWLSVAGVRLAKAREGIERAHGRDSTRVRLLQAGRYPEVALHLRLELLEGVVAYHNGHFDKSRKALTSAQAKYFQLQIPDEALSLLISMGYKEQNAKRALRMSNQDVGSAIDFLKTESWELSLIWIGREQRRYGVTPLNKAVDLQRLNEIVSIGFEKDLAAEALRRNENDTQQALDDLTNPETNSAIQSALESRKRKRRQQVEESTIAELVSMGFERSRVTAAVQACGSKELALSQLLGNSEQNPIAAANDNTNPSTSGQSDATLPNYVEPLMDNENVANADDIERDVEMEGELAQELQRNDAFSDYDIEVTNEGEAINEYLALLDSEANGKKSAA